MHPGTKGLHLLQHPVDRRHHILAPHLNRGVGAIAQGHMQHRAPLGVVNRLTAKHARAPLGQLPRLGQLQQQIQGLLGDTVFGKIQQQIIQTQREAGVALRVLVEEFAHMARGELLIVRLQGAPLGKLSQMGHRHPLFLLSNTGFGIGVKLRLKYSDRTPPCGPRLKSITP